MLNLAANCGVVFFVVVSASFWQDQVGCSVFSNFFVVSFWLLCVLCIAPAVLLVLSVAHQARLTQNQRKIFFTV